MKTVLKCFAIFLLIFSLQSCIVSANSIFNEETKGSATITKVNVPMFLVKPYIKKALREDGESEDLINLIKKIRKVKVYTVENATDKMVKDFTRKSFGNNLQEFLSINNKNSKIKISSTDTFNDNIIKDLLITIRDDKELVYVKVLGKFSMDDLAKIANSVEQNKEKISKNN